MEGITAVHEAFVFEAWRPKRPAKGTRAKRGQSAEAALAKEDAHWRPLALLK
jgi:hypothetical protein